MKLEIIDNLESLDRFRAEWRGFASSVPCATPFQLPDWQIAWWRHFGNGVLRIHVFREGSAVVGIVPCFLHDWQGRRQLTLIGSGISDYLDPLILPGAYDAVLKVLAEELSRYSDWEIANWQDLSAATPFDRFKESRAFHVQLIEDIPCSEIPIQGGFEEFWENRSYNLRRNVRRYRERAEKDGELQFKVTEEAEPALLEALISLHGRRWRKDGQLGMIETNHSADFLRDVAAELACHKMLKLFSIARGGQPWAILLAFVRAKRIFGYLTAFNPEFEAFGPGRILLFEALRYAFENAYCAWDFLRGNEPYKSSWGAQRIAKSRLIFQQERALTMAR